MVVTLPGDDQALALTIDICLDEVFEDVTYVCHAARQL